MPQPITNTIIGAGHCMGFTCSGTAITIIALAVAAVAVALLVWNGMFLYSYAQKSLAHLFWCIPITFIYMAIDVVFISVVARTAEFPTSFLANRTKEHYRGMRTRFRAAWIDA